LVLRFQPPRSPIIDDRRPILYYNSGMIRKILKADDPRLRKTSKPVKKIDKKIKNLAKDLVDTLKVQKDPEGVGLAACQVGKNLRMFAMLDGEKIRVIVNPEILKVYKSQAPKTKKAKNNKKIMEGCLSVPHYYGPLKRPPKLKLKYKNLEGKTKIEVFEGFPAQIVQHEVDHLNGILFVDKILEQKQNLYRLKNDEWEEVDLVI
jgi:peptide deformylase